MRAEIHSVAEKAPTPGEEVVILQIEDGLIAGMNFDFARVAIPDNAEEEALCQEKGEHPSMSWSGDGGAMYMTDYWMPRQTQLKG